MRPAEARGLAIGDRVCWLKDRKDVGTVVETNWASVKIKWDNADTPISYYLNDIASLTKVAG